MYLRVKICGLTDPRDGREAAQAGADAIGINFYPGSRRFVDAAKAKQILSILPPFVEAVGVFVNRRVEDVLAETIAPLGGAIRTIQIHRDDPDIPHTDCHFIPAFQIRDRHALAIISRYLERCREQQALPAAILVDGHTAGEFGGTGQPWPWELLADFRPKVPLILAGGLTPENVAEAVRVVQPYAVDVASGVESSPGRKDADKMRHFVANAREAAARLK
jgi:phosphoribosylanthranilate isomerase